jgi:flagella basal body P-ring formation protein FlgA
MSLLSKTKTLLLLGLILATCLQASLEDRLHEEIVATFQMEPWTSLDTVIFEFSPVHLDGLPAGATLSVQPLKSRLRGVNMHRVVISSSSGEHLRTLSLSTQLRSFEMLPLAKKDLMRGDILERNDLLYARSESTHFGESDLARLEDLLGKALQRNVKQGSEVCERFLKALPDVQRGSSLQVNLVQNGFEIQAAGCAEADACIGETLPVRILGSGKRLRARLITSDEAQLIGAGS